MLNSSSFGPFNPTAPPNLRGTFPSRLVVEPVDIDAPIGSVWQVLTDFDRYPDWNPFLRCVALEHEAAPGSYLRLSPSWGPYLIGLGRPFSKPDLHLRERITVWESPRCLAYCDERILHRGERVQYLEALADGKTRYHTFERMSGPLSLLVRLLYTRRILAGFIANGQALKVRVEALQHSPQP